MDEKEIFDEEPHETPMHDDADFAVLDDAMRSSRVGLIAADVKNSLNDVLKDYRKEPSNPVLRKSLDLALTAAVKLAVRGLLRRFPAMQQHGDDIEQDAWVRLLNQEKKDGQFLAKYDPNLEVRKQIYGYVWFNVYHASADIWKKLKATKSPPDTSLGEREKGEASSHDGDNVAGLTKAKRKTKKPGDYHEVSLSNFLDADETDAEEDRWRTEPKGMQVTEIPLNESETFLGEKDSFKRIGKLNHWLEQLADEMPGKTRSWLNDTGKLKQVHFKQNHSLIWRQWLAFSDSRFVGLTEDELGEEIGVSLAELKRYSSDAFEFMKQHPGYVDLLVLMIPTRNQKIGQSDMQAAEMKAAIEARGGRGNFRKLIHAWLVFHVKFDQHMAKAVGLQVSRRLG